MQTTIKNGQSLIDVAIQQSGDAGNAVALAIQNDLSLTENLGVGNNIQNAPVTNQSIVDFFNTELKNPATKDNVVEGQGIGFWGLGTTFKIG